MNFNSLADSIKSYFKDHSSEVLVGLGITTGVTATVLAVAATPKAMADIDLHKKATGKKTLTKGETVKLVWKFYIPTAVSTVVSISSILGASYLSNRNSAALATMVSVSEAGAKLYREKVVETIGEKKEKQVRDEVAKENLRQTVNSGNKVVVIGTGDVLCFDQLSRQVFKSDMQTIRAAQNDFNRDMLDEMYLSLNRWYDMLDLKHIEYGDNVGWSKDRGFLDLEFTSELIDGVPYLVLDLNNQPPYIDYKKY